MLETVSLKKPVILIVCNYYLPGFKAGGGLRTLVNTIERFGEQFDFRVIAFDHDGDGVPFDSVKIGEWNQIGFAQVFYLAQKEWKISKLRELIKTVNPQLIYLNSVFSILSIVVLTLRKLNLIPPTPTILAPEGELSDGALQLKASKKKNFTRLAKTLGLYKNLIWKVTSDLEKAEVRRFRGDANEIFIAPNMPSKTMLDDYRQAAKPAKKSGAARMIFLSRIARKKNLKWLMENLRNIEGNLTIDVYGPLEDEIYWQEIEETIERLPPNVKVNYQGQVAYEDVLATIFKYHFFILPTLGENFGHVFIEAMAAGCPLLISDRTPWTNLESRNIGWDLSLDDSLLWIAKINQCVALTQKSYEELSMSARNYAQRWLADPKIEEDTLKVLLYGLKALATH